MVKKLRIQIVFALVGLPAVALFAQAQGILRGRIIDAATGQGVLGAAVVVRGANAFAETDFDGKFELRLPEGTHEVLVQMAGFGPVRRQVTVRAGQVVSFNEALGLATAKGVEVKGRRMDDTEASVRQLQRQAGTVSDGISAEAIKRSPDSAAGEALKRVTGITVVDERFVFVRGLGERYSSTFLNDALLPSPEPDKRVVPLDIFPAGLIKNIRIIKTFAPEETGEFSGGLVKVETAEYPDQFLLTLGAGLGGNANTTGRHFLSSGPRGGLEWLGVDSGRRDPPGIVKNLPSTVPFQEGNQFGGLPAQFVQLGAAGFNNEWSPRKSNAPADRSFSFTIGDKLSVGTRGRFGVLYGTSYKREFRYRSENAFRYAPVNPVTLEHRDSTYLVPVLSRDSKRYSEEVLWGNNLNLAYEPIPGQQIYTKGLVSFLSENNVHKSTGVVVQNNNDFVAQSSGFVSRRLISQQVGGKHALNLTDGRPHRLEWFFNYAEALRDEPDLKQQLWIKNQLISQEIPSRSGSAEDGSRFLSETTDTIETVSLKYTLPFQQWDGLHSTFKLGGEASDRTRDFRSKTYQYRRLGARGDAELWPVPGEVTFHPARVVARQYLFEERNSDNSFYDASQKLHAYFGQVDMPILRGLRIVGGARYEDSYQYITTYNPFQQRNQHFHPEKPGIGEIHTKDLLPGVNLVWERDKQTNIRLGYSETVTRPDFRELSDFQFAPSFGDDLVRGNRSLTRTYVHSYDARYELYLKNNDYLGLGYFYKVLSRPIEQIGEPVAGGTTPIYTYANANTGLVRGIELDARKDFWERFRIDANMFFIRSVVQIMDYEQYVTIRTGLLSTRDRAATYAPTNLSRRLQGQSDYVYNAKFLYFFDKKKESSIGLYYNFFSDRIAVAGGTGLPDVIEQQAGLLDLVFEHKVGALSVKAAAKNITDTRFKLTQHDEVLGKDRLYRSYRKGVSYSASASYKF